LTSFGPHFNPLFSADIRAVVVVVQILLTALEAEMKKLLALSLVSLASISCVKKTPSESETSASSVFGKKYPSFKEVCLALYSGEAGGYERIYKQLSHLGTQQEISEHTHAVSTVVLRAEKKSSFRIRNADGALNCDEKDIVTKMNLENDGDFNLSGRGLTNACILRTFTGLKWLDLSNNNLSDVRCLEGIADSAEAIFVTNNRGKLICPQNSKFECNVQGEKDNWNL
jgi:hypothetical protein